MTPKIELEVKGNFRSHPFAELVTEISNAGLTGSLRVADKDKKWVVYFQSGKVVFAVSNARSSRLFDVLLRQGRITKAELAKCPEYSNDFEFSSFLEEQGLLTKADVDKLFVDQIKKIIVDSLMCETGEWTFSSLMRIREGLVFDVDTKRLLLDYVRCLPIEALLSRFRSRGERYSLTERPLDEIHLSPEEEFLYSRTTAEPQTAAQLIDLAAIPEDKARQALYTLWIAGLVERHGTNTAFDASHIQMMRGARLELIREAKLPMGTVASDESMDAPKEGAVDEPEFNMTVEQYLDQVEGAKNFYEVLGVDPRIPTHQLKQAYFRLARSFHPDRYHSEGGELLKRMLRAFTELAQAHETLKNQETRDMYDYRMRKELTHVETQEGEGGDQRDVVNREHAAENFETGFSLLMDDEAEAATPFLARAAHFAPNNARYHAYYGKALAFDEKQRHKAEAEIQTAIRIDPTNPTFKVLLAEFFIQFNLFKRAEGELKRLLEVYPSNKDALEMLEKLQNR